ncbi:hypothetical protein [Sphingobacterium detergens]|uniref:Lipoprotein n=1 Tax=Sphingobacterium detergens TaxID=1145106 RepID=A0A420B854_SPHD1|nr:hypothetical protein [Sphingobacterium detergens]RKE52839.1 hypothetical protein DFQ12_3085 [Sphingobacterium detergens]
MKSNLNTFLFFYAISFSALFLFSCGPKKKKREKELRILFNQEFVDEQYGEERYLSDSYRYDSAAFFVADNDTVPLEKWYSLLDEMAKLKRYKPEMNDIIHKHNYCSNLEIEFFDHEKSLCQLCLNPDNKTVRLNYLVYEVNPQLLSFFRNYISQDSAVFMASGKSDYVKKVMFNDRKTNGSQ